MQEVSDQQRSSSPSCTCSSRDFCFFRLPAQFTCFFRLQLYRGCYYGSIASLSVDFFFFFLSFPLQTRILSSSSKTWLLLARAARADLPFRSSLWNRPVSVVIYALRSIYNVRFFSFCSTSVPHGYAWTIL